MGIYEHKQLLQGMWIFFAVSISLAIGSVVPRSAHFNEFFFALSGAVFLSITLIAANYFGRKAGK